MEGSVVVLVVTLVGLVVALVPGLVWLVLVDLVVVLATDSEQVASEHPVVSPESLLSELPSLQDWHLLFESQHPSPDQEAAWVTELQICLALAATDLLELALSS